ncbi:MAG: hypothetical protein WCY84_06445 [Candidatus Cloacimonadaceae bacterium]
MKKPRLYTCEIKRYRQIAPELCAVCPRVLKCRSFRAWYSIYHQEYLNFVLDIVDKFPEKYELEVYFMAEKQHFVQIVDMATGKIDRIANLKEINAMSAEEKLALSRNKNLFVVTHRLEPIVKVEMKRTVISSPMDFANPEAQEAEKEAPKAKEIPAVEAPAPAKPKTRKKS